jgi:hypothetical protein
MLAAILRIFSKQQTVYHKGVLTLESVNNTMYFHNLQIRWYLQDPHRTINYAVDTLTNLFAVNPTTGQMYLTVSQLGLTQDNYTVSILP